MKNTSEPNWNRVNTRLISPLYGCNLLVKTLIMFLFSWRMNQNQRVKERWTNYVDILFVSPRHRIYHFYWWTIPFSFFFANCIEFYFRSKEKWDTCYIHGQVHLDQRITPLDKEGLTCYSKYSRNCETPRISTLE